MKHKKSELLRILKEASHQTITPSEHERACTLIENPVYSQDNCRLCKIYCPEDIKKAIFDTGLCKAHAFYALVTGK